MISNNHKFLSQFCPPKFLWRTKFRGGYSSGFTLLELMVVCVIIGILATIAMPQYITTIEKARSGEAVINIGVIRVALDRSWYQNGALPRNDNFAALDVDNPNNITNKLFLYSFKDNGTSSSTRKYSVTAVRVDNPGTWVKWIQTDNVTGKITRSENLGGPAI